MSATVDWGSGLTDLMRDVAALPRAVRAELKPRVIQRAQNIVSRTQAEYGARGVADVGRGMRVESGDGDADVSARVKNPSPLAHLYEFGTANRYNSRGAFRGRMPAANVFVPIVESERAQLVGELTDAVNEAKVGSTLTVR